MKTIKLFTILSVTIALFFSCSSVGGNPDKVAKKFVKAMQNRDFDEAKKYCTQESMAMFNIARGVRDSTLKSMNKKVEHKTVKIEIVKTQITPGDTAALVIYKLMPAGRESRLELVKKNDYWKVKNPFNAL